ncbi:MAG: hypothetical protein ACFFCC_17415 [Promethearchaeota archaeon]
MNIKFWQTRVKIKQIPSILASQEFINPITQKPVEIEMSWLFDPFLDQTVYGLELSLNETFSFTFFLYAETESEAIKKGHSFLMILSERFPGLTGEVSALPISESMLTQTFPTYELIFPRGNFVPGDKFSIIKKIIQIFKVREFNVFQFYIIWQKDDSINYSKYSRVSVFELYKLKIFIRVIPEKRFEYNELQMAQLEGRLDYLTTGIRNTNGERARIKKTRINGWEKIISTHVFWCNTKNQHTGHCYRDIYKNLPEERIPAFITPDQVDFTFPDDLPLQKSIKPPLENIDFSTIDDKNSIPIGNVIVNGVETTTVKNLPTTHFAHSIFIGGQTGAGKTYLLGHICRQFYNQAPDIGILILNLGKGRQEGFYTTDKVLKYGSSELHLNYFHKGEHLYKSLQETATYLVASLGLRSPCDKILYNVMRSFIDVNGSLPRSLKTLFDGLKKYFLEHPYHNEYQTNILRALQNRIPTLLSDPILEKTLELSLNNQVPKWFQDWRNGKTIYLDLSMCDIYIKRLLSNAIFQMVKTLIPDVEAGKLQNIVVIEEAFNILEKPITSNPDEDDYISREQLELIFNNLIREFRSKGLSFFISDNVPHRLFNCALTLPNLKILFSLSNLDSTLFTNNLKTQEYLMLQKPRHALVLNGNNEEIFVIKTPDYSYSGD